MRIKLIQESVRNGDWWALPGSILWSTRRIPVTERDFIMSPRDVIGYLENIRREEDGWITGDVKFFVDTTKEDLKYKTISFELHPVVGHYFKDLYFLDAGDIRSASIKPSLNEGNIFYDND